MNHLPSESQSIGESPAELIQSIGESPADSKTESLQSNNNTGLTEIFENPTPKDSIPKSPFYYNTPAAPPNISLLLEGTAKKLQPQEKPFCLEERQRQLQEQSKAILAKYPPKSSKKAWEEIRSVGYGPVGKEATA